MAAHILRTDVAIIGGGPAGLMLAIELGCRGVRCVVLEEDADAPVPPKANATSARTMEHYRRRGFAAEVRQVGLAADHPQDVVYCTRLGGSELARFVIPSRNQAAARSSFGDLGETQWPTPELPHRGNQMFIEPILRRQARSHDSVDLRFLTRATALQDLGDKVVVDAVEGPQGAALQIEAAYAVGCEGARSIVREAMGTRFAGLGAEQREFFGGQMLGLFFRSPDLYELLGRKAWTWWLLNPQQRGVLVAIDGVDRFILGIQLKPGQTADDVDADTLFRSVARGRFSAEVLDRSVWTAGHMLVAERLQAGRLFIAGDAAHLFTPTGGMGYNTSVDDAVNLGWKLAAVVQGFAPAALLDSYEAERRPIAERNTQFARAMAESIGRMAIPAALEDEGAEGERLRSELGAKALAHGNAEFNIPGVQLGLRYESAVVASEAWPPPPDERNHYAASGYPGVRAPHVALPGGDSIFDRFGRDFTLLVFGGGDVGHWHDAARSHGVPLTLLHWPDAATASAARTLYGADLVLVRPDHHIAWRGDTRADATSVLGQALGNAAGATA